MRMQRAVDSASSFESAVGRRFGAALEAELAARPASVNVELAKIAARRRSRLRHGAVAGVAASVVAAAIAGMTTFGFSQDDDRGSMSAGTPTGGQANPTASASEDVRILGAKANEYVGLTVSQAISLAEQNGLSWRIVPRLRGVNPINTDRVNLWSETRGDVYDEDTAIVWAASFG